MTLNIFSWGNPLKHQEMIVVLLMMMNAVAPPIMESGETCDINAVKGGTSQLPSSVQRAMKLTVEFTQTLDPIDLAYIEKKIDLNELEEELNRALQTRNDVALINLIDNYKLDDNMMSNFKVYLRNHGINIEQMIQDLFVVSKSQVTHLQKRVTGGHEVGCIGTTLLVIFCIFAALIAQNGHRGLRYFGIAGESIFVFGCILGFFGKELCDRRPVRVYENGQSNEQGEQDVGSFNEAADGPQNGVADRLPDGANNVK
eukprot:NODE_99_length_20465_cov_0.827654.p5 type:complete len:257 gc:universal NODE_99_length_20465_cov_0.827654:7282-6512(-)